MEGYDWYADKIEEPVRELVMALRNNGINTTCSCGHRMYVEGDFYFADETRHTIHSVLVENGWEEYELTLRYSFYHHINNRTFYLDLDPHKRLDINKPSIS